MAVTTGTSSTVFGQDTLPKLFRHVVRERGHRVAMREKELGVWHAVSWSEYGERAKHVGLGLVALGLRHRDDRHGGRRLPDAVSVPQLHL